VGLAKSMRHLRVPSKETSLWRDKIASNGWLLEGHGIHNLGDFRGIPLNESAPLEIEGLEIVELDPLKPGPQHWTERIDQELYQKHRELWPTSHDRVGDVIIVKIPSEIIQYSNVIGEAMLSQYHGARIVCADNGVKGEFRVRDLAVISTKGDTSTKTKVKEHGNEFWIDPSLVYYSPRLATERLGNIESAIKLAEKLGRKIAVCDPYAGVGPALVPLSKMTESVSEIYGSDLNPYAAELLSLNLPGHNTGCADARDLATTHPECCDMLLVNLPHESIEHLPHLIGLLKKGHEVVIRGWAILPSASLEEAEIEIHHHLSETKILSIDVKPKKSYASNIEYVSFEAHIIRN